MTQENASEIMTGQEKMLPNTFENGKFSINELVCSPSFLFMRLQFKKKKVYQTIFILRVVLLLKIFHRRRTLKSAKYPFRFIKNHIMMIIIVETSLMSEERFLAIN